MWFHDFKPAEVSGTFAFVTLSPGRRRLPPRLRLAAGLKEHWTSDHGLRSPHPPSCGPLISPFSPRGLLVYVYERVQANLEDKGIQLD